MSVREYLASFGFEPRGTRSFINQFGDVIWVLRDTPDPVVVWLFPDAFLYEDSSTDPCRETHCMEIAGMIRISLGSFAAVRYYLIRGNILSMDTTAGRVVVNLSNHCVIDDMVPRGPSCPILDESRRRLSILTGFDDQAWSRRRAFILG